MRVQLVARGIDPARICDLDRCTVCENDRSLLLQSARWARRVATVRSRSVSSVVYGSGRRARTLSRVRYSRIKTIRTLRRSILYVNKERCQRVRAEVDLACEKAGRNPHEVLLLAVSETVDLDQVQEAIEGWCACLWREPPR